VQQVFFMRMSKSDRKYVSVTSFRTDTVMRGRLDIQWRQKIVTDVSMTTWLSVS